jgi:PAS domain S-box-containing protein
MAEGASRGGPLELERLYAQLIETTSDAVLITDAEQYLLVNEAAEQLLGYRRAELLRRSPMELLEVIGLTHLTEVGLQLEEAGSWRGEWRLRRKDGRVVPVEATISRHDTDGRVLYLSLFRDITHRKRTEVVLQRREAQLTEAQRIAHLGSWEWDIVADRLSWSDEQYRIFGHEPQAFLLTPKSGGAGIHLEDVVRVWAIVEGALSTGEPFEYEARILRPDGEERMIHCRGAVLRDAASRPERMVGTAQDITERKRAELALREHRDFLQAVIDAVPDPIFVKDDQHRWVLGNQTFWKVFALDPATALGKLDFDLLPASEAAVYWEKDDLVLRTGETNENEEVMTDGEGRTRQVLTKKSRFQDASGRPVLVGVIRDITERKRDEVERERLLASEQAAVDALWATQQQVIQQERLRALGQMASGVAHDFNNALSPIVAYTDLLLTQPEKLVDQARVTGFLEMIQTAAEDATGVVRRLREFYRQREGDEIVEPVHLDDLVAQVISLTQFRWKDQAQARGADITIVTERGHLSPVAGIPADLREALTNLVFNAVDAMPDGGTIRIVTRTEIDTVVLSVCDTGQGMTAETRLRCLEPFFTTKGNQGTGLGLGLVFGIVQRHRGALEIESTPGKGTTVRVRLPIWSPTARVAAAPSTLDTVRPLRVLVIEDEPLIRRAYIEYLSVDKHWVETAPDGRAGLEMFRAGAFDLVVTDRALPEMGGDQVATSIKQLAPDVPIIMVTGFGDLMNQHGQLPDGVDLVVSKPLTLAALRDAIAQVAG